MPERPDLEYVVPILARELTGRQIRAVRVKKPVVLRVAVPGAFDALLVGRAILGVTRHAHFVRFALGAHDLGGCRGGRPPGALDLGGCRGGRPPGALDLIVSPMLAGRFLIAPDAGAKATADLAVAWALDDGRELRYRDDVQMGKVYLTTAGDATQVPGLATIGLDVLDKQVFTRAAFRALAKTRRDQAKVFLMDKTALDAMGNAYADEVLFAAGLHPKTMVRSLSVEDVDRLHAAIVSVIGGATKLIARRKPPLDEKLRDFLKVRNRAGEPCPNCGTKLRKAGVHGHDAFFCPQCQPETRRSGIVDWRKLDQHKPED